MPYIDQFNNCCAVHELGGLDGITEAVLDDMMEEYVVRHQKVVAITSSTQKAAAKVLSNYGFTKLGRSWVALSGNTLQMWSYLKR